GAALGYGTGAAAEWLLPRRWEKGRLRGTLGILGGLAGMAPAGVWALNNSQMGKPFYAGSLFNADKTAAARLAEALDIDESAGYARSVDAAAAAFRGHFAG